MRRGSKASIEPRSARSGDEDFRLLPYGDVQEETIPADDPAGWMQHDHLARTPGIWVERPLHAQWPAVAATHQLGGPGHVLEAQLEAGFPARRAGSLRRRDDRRRAHGCLCLDNICTPS